MQALAAYQRCCQSIIGCIQYITKLYQGNKNKHCPKCRKAGGLISLFDAHGLNDLLHGLSFLSEGVDN